MAVPVYLGYVPQAIPHTNTGGPMIVASVNPAPVMPTAPNLYGIPQAISVGNLSLPQLAQPAIPVATVADAVPNVVTARLAQPVYPRSQVTNTTTAVAAVPQPAIRVASRDPGQKGNNKVICLLGVSAHTDLDELETAVERTFQGTNVVRRLPIWNKATVFMELNRPVTWSSSPTMINDQGVTAVSSQKTCIALSSRTMLINVRFFLLDPTQDFDGDETQRASYATSQQIWEQSQKNQQVWLGLGALLQRASDVAWKELLTPRRPARISDEGPRQRMYAQLFFKYEDESEAEAALGAADGKYVDFGHLRFIMRTAFAATHTVAAAPRIGNPALVNAAEFGNIYSAVDRVRQFESP